MTTESARPLVVITESLDQDWLSWLAQRCHVKSMSTDAPQFNTLAPQVQGLIVRTYTRVDSALLDRLPELRVVARAGVGLDNINVPACRARGVEVVFTPGANIRAVVELVTALLLEAVRPRVHLSQALDPKTWKTRRTELIAHRQLSDMTLGILGLGRVGKAIARIGAAFDMRVQYHDLIEIDPSERCGAEPVDWMTLATTSDVLSLHVDNRPDNRHLINADALAHMRENVILINTSRVFVVDAAALSNWLTQHPSAMAILDVHDPEPFSDSYPLLCNSNARLTPHIGAATATAHRNMSSVVEDVLRVLTGERPCFPAP